MRVVTCVALMFVTLGLATTAWAGHHETGLMKEVEAIGDSISKAMVEGDFEFMLGLYTEDVISLPNYGPRMDGIDAFRKHQEQMKASGMKIHSFESSPTDVWECGDQVIEIGTYTISLDAPGMPDTIEDKGKYLTVYVRDADGSLKIKAETWNTDMSPMGMGAPEHGHEH